MKSFGYLTILVIAVSILIKYILKTYIFTLIEEKKYFYIFFFKLRKWFAWPSIEKNYKKILTQDWPFYYWHITKVNRFLGKSKTFTLSFLKGDVEKNWIPLLSSMWAFKHNLIYLTITAPKSRNADLLVRCHRGLLVTYVWLTGCSLKLPIREKNIF